MTYGLGSGLFEGGLGGAEFLGGCCTCLSIISGSN